MAGERQVKVTLVVDSTGAVHAMRTAGEESHKTEGKFEHLDKGTKRLGHSFGGLKTMIGAGLGAIGVAGIGYGIKDVVSGMQEAAEATEHFSAVSGIGEQQSLYLTQALKARGIDANTGGKAFGFLTKNLQTAERQWHGYNSSQTKALATGKLSNSLLGVQATAFKELGLNVGALSKMSGEQKLQTVVKAFEHMPESLRKSGEAGSLMKQIFGKGGESLATVLEGGALGLTSMTNAAKEFFPTIKSGSLEELRVQTARSDLAFEGLKFTLGQQLIPVIFEVDKWFTHTIKEFKAGHGTWYEVYKDIESVAKWLGHLWEGFSDVVGPANAVKSVIGGMAAVWAVGKVIAFTSAIKAMTPVLGTSIALLGPEVLILTAAAIGLYEALKHVEEFRSLLGMGNTQTYIGGKKVSKGQTESFLRRQENSPSVLIGSAEGHIANHHPLEVGAKELHEIKVELHLDSIKAAEALVRSPGAIRKISEGSAHYTSKMAARGAHR